MKFRLSGVLLSVSIGCISLLVPLFGTMSFASILDWDFVDPVYDARVNEAIDVEVILINPGSATESVTLTSTVSDGSIVDSSIYPNTLIGSVEGTTFIEANPYDFTPNYDSSNWSGITLDPGSSVYYTAGTLTPIDTIVPAGTYSGSFSFAEPFTSTSGESAYKEFSVNVDWYQAIDEIELQTVTRTVNSAQGSWDYSYDISFQGGDVLVDLDIRLTGDTPSQALLNQWETGIEQIWSDGFHIYDHGFTYDIDFDVDFVGLFSDYDQIVEVHSGPPCVGQNCQNTDMYNMSNWYTDATHWGANNIMQDEIVAHEFGHMLGLYDEYPGGWLDPDTNFTSYSLMGMLLPNGQFGSPLMDHYLTILEWLQDESGRPDLMLAAAPFPSYYYDTPTNPFYDGAPVNGVNPIPEPATMLLFGTGIAGLIGTRLRRKK